MSDTPKRKQRRNEQPVYITITLMDGAFYLGRNGQLISNPEFTEEELAQAKERLDKALYEIYMRAIELAPEAEAKEKLAEQQPEERGPVNIFETDKPLVQLPLFPLD